MMWQKIFLQPKKLFIEVGHHDSEVTLAEALAGKAGKLTLGSSQVGLWTPNTKITDNSPAEFVCDLRFLPLSGGSTADKFKEAMKGRFLPAHFVLFRGSNTKKIAEALELFDFVIVANPKLKNLAPFRKRVLGYRPPKQAHLNAPIIKDV